MTIRRLVTGGLLALLLASIVIIFFNRLAGADLILARGDTLLYFYPYWQFAADVLKEGQVLLWNPNLFMGAPFLANSQVGFFYPLNWPLWLLFDTPYAASFSIILHIVIASFGSYLMARRCFSLSRTAAVLAALLFSLGGYLTAQVEHLNQLQGLAWLPWYFVVLCQWRPNLDRRAAIRLSASIAAILSLQLLSGHTQTAFISLVAVAIWLIVTWFGSLVETRKASEGNFGISVWIKFAWSYASPVFWGVLLALCIAAVQLLPTLELSSQSLRSGGLPANEVLSFSLQPLQLGQSLLPAYDSVVFSEYVLFVPITALLLAIVGARRLWHKREGRPLLILAGIGLFLALGRFNPVSYLLAIVPGFNYFRAPARWSVLFALAIAMAAGAGWQALSRFGRDGQPEDSSDNQYFRTLIIGVAVIILLIAWSIISAYLAPLFPAATESVIEQPTLITMLIWIGELVVASVLIYLLIRYQSGAKVAWAIIFLTVAILFMSTRALSYNHPTTAQAYFEQRPPVSRLLVSAECNSEENGCGVPNGRILSLSDIFFDLGDQTELSGIYGPALGDKEWFDYLVASKQKEVLGPNLPLAFGLESVDGFDGGVLPLERYALLMGLILPDQELAFDGRLREYLDSVPDEKWLDLLGARYVITDKVGDQWRREVFFDMKLPTTVTQASGAVDIGFLPSYEATSLWLIGDDQPGTITVVTRNGREWSLSPEQIESDVWQVTFPESTSPTKITLNPCDPYADDLSCDSEWQVKSLALVDERDGSFLPLTAGDYRLIYSGDVKIYENLDVMPRVLLMDDWHFVDDAEEGIALMQSADFDPSVSAVVLGPGPESIGDSNGHASLISYLPENIKIRTESDALALLLVTDAFYPGWEATIDGVPVEISIADIMFRGIFVPPGEHEIELLYVPASYQVGRLISIAGLVVWLAMAIYAFILPHITNRRNANRTSDAS